MRHALFGIIGITALALGGCLPHDVRLRQAGLRTGRPQVVDGGPVDEARFAVDLDGEADDGGDGDGDGSVSGRAPAPHSPVCDHKTPHRGNAALFRDPANLWTLCKACHDSDKQGQEVRGYSRAPDATGWPSDPRHPANRKA